MWAPRFRFFGLEEPSPIFGQSRAVNSMDRHELVWNVPCGHYFLAPCIWLSLVRAICLRSTRLLLFREMTPGMVSVCSTLLGSTADTCSTLVYVHVRQVPQVQSWKRQLISHSCSPLTLGLGCAGQQVPQVQSARRQSRSHCCCSFMPELQYIDKVVDVPVVVLMPVVVQRQVP